MYSSSASVSVSVPHPLRSLGRGHARADGTAREFGVYEGGGRERGGGAGGGE